MKRQRSLSRVEHVKRVMETETSSRLFGWGGYNFKA